MRNTRNLFSTSQRQNILSKLVDYLPNFNSTDEIFIDLPITALKGIGVQLGDSALEYELWLDSISGCLAQRNRYKWINWGLSIRKFAGIVNATMIPFLSKNSQNNLTQILLIKKIKGIINLLEEWIVSELVVYENFTIQSTLFSIHSYMFSSNVPITIENSSMIFNDTILKTTFNLPVIFARTGFLSEDKIITNSSSPYRYAISTIIYNTNYLFNDNTTNLLPISLSTANVSLFYFMPSSLILNRYQQNQTILNSLYNPTITFYDVQSPLNVSESYCACPQNTSCIARIMFNTTGVLCEFHTTGMLFASVNFVASIITVLYGNIPILIIYVGTISGVFYGLIALSFWLDNKEVKMLEGINNFSGEREIREHIMHQYIAEEKSKFSCLNLVMLLMKVYHPLLSIYFKLNPIIPRENRVILQLLICHIASTLLLISFQTNSLFKYSSDWNNLWNWVLLSILVLPFQAFADISYDFLMVKSYTKRSYFTKPIENNECESASKNEIENVNQDKSNEISESERTNKCMSPDKLVSSPIEEEKKEMENPEIVEETHKVFEKFKITKEELKVIPEVCETFGVSEEPKEEDIDGECEVKNDPKEDMKIGINSFIIAASKPNIVIEYENPDSQQGTNIKEKEFKLPVIHEENKVNPANEQREEKDKNKEDPNIEKSLEMKDISVLSAKKVEKEEDLVNITKRVKEEHKSNTASLKGNSLAINPDCNLLNKAEDERKNLGVIKNPEEEKSIILNKSIISHENQKIDEFSKIEGKEEDIVIIDQKEDKKDDEPKFKLKESVQQEKPEKHKKKLYKSEILEKKRDKNNSKDLEASPTMKKHEEQKENLLNCKSPVLSSIIIEPEIEIDVKKEEQKSNIIIKSLEEIKIEEVKEPSEELKQQSKIIHRFNTESLANTNIEVECASPYWKTEEVVNCNLTSYHQEDPMYEADDHPNGDISLTMPIVKTQKAFSFFRNFFSPLFFIIVMASSLFYNGTTIIEAETNVIITWIISSLIIGLFVFLFWNTLWIIIVGLMGYFYKKSSSGKVKSFLFIILPGTVCDIATEYACKI